MEIRRRAKASIVFDAAPSCILDFEGFIEDLSFLSPLDRCRLLVAGGETLDNIIKHGSPLRGGRVAATVRRRGGFRPGIVLRFSFRSSRFEVFARKGSGRASTPPFFDPELRRWRGFGLVMCRNLSRRIAFLPGLIIADRIVLEFDSGA
jgi:hypothetical protein